MLNLIICIIYWIAYYYDRFIVIFECGNIRNLDLSNMREIIDLVWVTSKRCYS